MAKHKIWWLALALVVASSAFFLALMGLRRPAAPQLLFLEGEEPVSDHSVEYGWGLGNPLDLNVHRNLSSNGEPGIERVLTYSLDGDFDGVCRFMDSHVREKRGRSTRWNPFEGYWFIGDDVDVYLSVNHPDPESKGKIFVKVSVRKDLGAGGYFTRFCRSPLRVIGL